jgi:CubicO group peptidase (beta-lactamase class C family)
MHEALKGFDEYMDQTLANWNAPGIGVCVVADNEVVLSQGYGWRDYGEKLPFTPSTLFPIASNTKLFTAVAAGLLVEEGKLSWDRPIRESVPSIKFSSDALDNNVTLRDMLAHRTGIHRHDKVWNKSSFTTQELFDRLRHLQPVEPLRQSFIYNNLMYAGVGHVIELVTGETWQAFVQRRLLDPLGMRDTVFSLEQMLRHSAVAVPYNERRDSTELFGIPRTEQMHGASPAGGMISSMTDMARWLRMLMNDGIDGTQQVVPAKVLKETLAPSVALPNALAETRGFRELLNATYGMGRHTAIYRGHLMTYHGGTLDGVHSQVAYLPHERIGVITFVIGDHCAVLRDTVVYNILERMLGLAPTPWNERWLDVMHKFKAGTTAARSKAGADRIPGTQPSHPLEHYAGDYEHPAYGKLHIRLESSALHFQFRGPALPLTHVHYERFDTPDDELQGKWTVNFSTDPLGEVSALHMSLDQAEAAFVRCNELPTPELLALLAGGYTTVSGLKWQVMVKDRTQLCLSFPGQPDLPLAAYKHLKFRIPQFPDRIYEFVMQNDTVLELKIAGPEGTYLLSRS